MNPATSENLVEISDLHFSYGDRLVLKGINLKIQRGKVVAILGVSGSGKTTLLRLLGGQLKPQRGCVKVAGQIVHELDEDGLYGLRRDMGMMFQMGGLYSDMSVFDNVAFPLRVRGLPPVEMKANAFKLLQQVGLDGKRLRFPRELAGGEQQRVAVARALITNPKIILADEPTGNLDAQVALEVLKLLLDANRRGATILLATHNPNLVASIRNKRLLELEAGRLVRNEVLT